MEWTISTLIALLIVGDIFCVLSDDGNLTFEQLTKTEKAKRIIVYLSKMLFAVGLLVLFIIAIHYFLFR